jgi:hypothetical protein
MTWENRRSALGGTRTPNLLIRSQMLYPLSYERRCHDSLRHARLGRHQPHAALGLPRGSG